MWVMAVDWSGAQRNASRKIWLAEAKEGQLVTLESGRDRQQLAAHLLDIAHEHQDLIVGLDFAFSMPAWFVEEAGCATAREFWAMCAATGEQWLATCPLPFWGRPGRPCPQDDNRRFRQTELDVPRVSGIRPKSVFQIGGAGAVGTGSIRGMAVLCDLVRGGYSVYSFDAPSLPMLVEIYPRLLTGRVRKTSAPDRAEYLQRCYPGVSGQLLKAAVGSEDAFDAAVSALVMEAHIYELRSLQPTADIVEQLEGRI